MTDEQDATVGDLGLKMVSYEEFEGCAEMPVPDGLPEDFLADEPQDEEEFAEHYAWLDGPFLGKVAAGTARRLDLGGGVYLDLVRAGGVLDPFYIGRFPVTQEQFELVMGGNPSDYDGLCRGKHPVDKVTWAEADAFCRKLGDRFMEERGDSVFTLPTGVQWEEAARGGEGWLYAGGDDLDEVGWCEWNACGRTHAVGLKKPNALGVQDMTGNVEEWCLEERTSEDGTPLRLLRGGGYLGDRVSVDPWLLSDGDSYGRADRRLPGVGFRVALVPPGWEASHGEEIKRSVAARREELEKSFRVSLATGGARRFDLGEGVPLDLSKVGGGPDAFHMGRFPVTQRQYELVMGENPSVFAEEESGSHPVENVSWSHAVAFCNRLNDLFRMERGELVFGLPSVRQWETAACAGARGPYGGAERISLAGWTAENAGGGTHAVGMKAPNRFGLHDMNGNVWEWCADRGEEKDGEETRRRCGGCYHEMASEARSDSFRDGAVGLGSYDTGFRVALAPADWSARRAEDDARSAISRHAGLENGFLDKVSAGEAVRLDLRGGFPLDLVKVGAGEDMYYLGRFPVTQGQYEAVTGVNPSFYAEADRSLHPVENVSWDEAMAFCAKLNELPAERRGGLVFTLPTEAQWMNAARAGEDAPYAGGSDLGEVAWYLGNSLGQTHAVAMKEPNAWGLHDLCGNVSEWCLDEEQGEPGRERVHPLHGGSLYDFAWECTVDRGWGRPASYRAFIAGFRVAAVRR